MARPNLPEVTIHPTADLVCPNCGARFDRKALEGKDGYIVHDLREPKKNADPKKTDCSRCKKVWDGIDIPLSQGFCFYVVLKENVSEAGDWEWGDTVLLSSADFTERVKA